MNVLVVGSGGREHALVWKIAQSAQVDKVYCAPGNAGIADAAECVDIGVNDFDALAAFAKDHAVGLTVCGPEDPLCRGIADHFQAQGLALFGPSASGARIEASKAFAKDLMRRCGIPAAQSAEFTDSEEAIAYAKEHGAPLVVKADGLAAGKGVTVAHSVDTAIEAICAAMLDKAFGEAGQKVVIEEFLEGEEASILAFTDGENVLPMATSQDHKPVFDGGAGPNTGGMGAYSPVPAVTAEMFGEITRTILEPCVRGLADEGAAYRGVLYAGLMLTADGPKVIEFNCRFGDPETQAVLPRMQTDIVPVFLACCEGTLKDVQLEWREDACVSVVMASGGYPGPYEKGQPITGLEAAAETGAVVFHAGTRRDGGQVLTAGGRVLNVTALGADIPTALDVAYKAVSCIHFDGAHYRSDIGHNALARM